MTVAPARPLLIYFNSSIASNTGLIEYAIQQQAAAEPVWQTTTKLRPAVITQSKAGSTYQLLLRYSFQPETQQAYTITVTPYWWQTTTTIIIFFIAAVFFFAGILLYFYRKKMATKELQQREALEKQMLKLKAIRLQLNPHFVFNALSSIQGLMNTGDVKSANVYLSEFGKLMRNTLDNSEQLYSPLSQEVSLLTSYLNLEQLRFGFEYKWQISNTVDVDGVEIPTLLLQPLVENAVKHGVAFLKKAGFIEIRIELQHKNLVITITDNGAGITEPIRFGHGLSLTEKRIQLFNQILKEDKIQKSYFRKEGATHIKIFFKNWLA